MRGRSGAGNEKHPHISIDSIAPVMFRPTQVMEGGFRRQTELPPQPISDKSVQAGTLIDFVEMRHRLPGKELRARSLVTNRRTFDVVEQTFDKVGGGTEVFQSLLILNADCRATESVGHTHRRHVHFALHEYLLLR